MTVADAVDLVVFDFDGTLCDSADVKTDAFYRLYLEEAGEEVAARVRDHHVTHAGVSRYDKIRHYEEAFLGRSCDAERLEELAGRFAQLVEGAVIAAPMLPGACDFLAGPGRAVTLAVASATPTGELRRIVAAKGLGHFFAAVTGSPTAKGAIVAGYLQAFGVRVGRAVVVGDQRSDAEAAQATGSGFVGVRPPGAPRLFGPEVPVIPDLRGLEGAIAAAVS